MLDYTAKDTVGRLATAIPQATRVFARHNIDFCCGGGRTLDEACRAKGADAAAILAEIEAETVPDEARCWETEPLTALIEHIIVRHHRPLDEEMPRLLTMAKKVRARHGDTAPGPLDALVTVLEGLFTELIAHMTKEERVLFPWIESGSGRTAGAPIRVMYEDHDDAASALKQIRELTDDFRIPAGACATWKALWIGLEAFDADLRQHIHLENNILFPRALAG